MRGAVQMVARVKAVARQFPNRIKAALNMESEIEVTEMKRRTPVDTRPNAPHPGQLRNSLHVEEVEQRGNNFSATIATGAEADYAIYVHENPDAFHPIGQWKFMESVINESQPFMAQRIGRRLDLDKSDVS